MLIYPVDFTSTIAEAEVILVDFFVFSPRARLRLGHILRTGCPYIPVLHQIEFKKKDSTRSESTSKVSSAGFQIRRVSQEENLNLVKCNETLPPLRQIVSATLLPNSKHDFREKKNRPKTTTSFTTVLHFRNIFQENQLSFNKNCLSSFEKCTPYLQHRLWWYVSAQHWLQKQPV